MSDLKNKETPQEIRNREIILLVQRQTGYTEDIAKEKLKQYNNNYIDVIKSYVNPEYKLVKNQTKPRIQEKRVLNKLSSS